MILLTLRSLMSEHKCAKETTQSRIRIRKRRIPLILLVAVDGGFDGAVTGGGAVLT